LTAALASGAAAQQPARRGEPAAVATADSLHAAAGRQFAAADSNRDGVLTRDELRASAHRLERGDGMGLSLINWPGWDRVAAERGGRIAAEDLTAAYIARLEDLDRDGDGALTRAEMQASDSERMLIVCPACGNAACAEAERRMEAARQSRVKSGREFERLDWRFHGYYRFNSALDRPLYNAVRDYRSWHAMWDRIVARHGASPLSPSVDFSKDMILIAATGAKGSGGYGIQIVSVRETAKELVATAVRTSPGPRCGATAAITAPADIVRVPISRKPVRWTLRDRLADCS
jgi:hypothetical protein